MCILLLEWNYYLDVQNWMEILDGSGFNIFRGTLKRLFSIS